MKIKSFYIFFFGLILGIILTGLITLFFLPNLGEPIEAINSSKNENSNLLNKSLVGFNITFHISGEVKNPGVYKLPFGSNLKDAVDIAGGLTENADPNLLNLAAQVEDGAKIYISQSSKHQTLTESLNQKILSLININTATFEELISLPGIGEAKAQAIIDYRLENGYFTNLEQLKNVPGIGDSIYSKMLSLITLGP